MTRDERVLKRLRERFNYFKHVDDAEFLSLVHCSFRDINDHICLEVDHEMLEERVKALEEAEHRPWVGGLK